MNLLPKQHFEFAKEKYWNEFFAKIGAQPFEWYGEYNHLCEILHRYMRVKEKLLVVGCGNSKLSADLYDVGFCNITSIDISENVIKQMKEKYGKDRPKMVFERMDMFQMDYENEDFTVVLDKGTLDAVMVDNSKETNVKVDKMFSEISRILKHGGRYICISLLQEQILHKVLDWFPKEGWMVRIHRCFQAENSCDAHNPSIIFPVFVIILTKMKKILGSTTILELAIETEDSPKRVEKNDVISSVKAVQNYAFLKHYLSKKKLIDEDVCLELYCSVSAAVKYRLYVVDKTEKAALKFAVFIVPQGRETEWLFATSEGRRHLATDADCERLIVVHLLRNSTYESLDEIRKDLSGKVMELAPLHLKAQVPFLSVGEDVGSREIRSSGKTDLSGDYIIEDVIGDDNQMFRRLIFLNNQHLIQSEAKLKKAVPKKKKKKRNVKQLEIDFDYLACNHHTAMISGLAFLKSEITGPRILQIGLGGGSLAMYLYRHFQNAKLDTVELDPVIAMIAKKWFGVITDDRLTVNIADGISFIQEAVEKGTHYDAIMLDVDNKDSVQGMSCPPSGFLELSLLSMMSQLVAPSGVVIMNFVCRNTTLRTEAYAKIKSIFRCVLFKKIPNEVNEIIYCLIPPKSDDLLQDLKRRSLELMAKLKEHSCSSDIFDVTALTSSLETIM